VSETKGRARAKPLCVEARCEDRYAYEIRHITRKNLTPWTATSGMHDDRCMAAKQPYEDDLWNTLQKNGWRVDDAEAVAGYAEKFPDADVLSSDVHACAERLLQAAGVTAKEMSETALAAGPLWDELGTDLTFQWAMHTSRGMGGALAEWLANNPYEE
jgi:hypothetical protein